MNDLLTVLEKLNNIIGESLTRTLVSTKEIAVHCEFTLYPLASATVAMEKKLVKGANLCATANLKSFVIAVELVHSGCFEKAQV